MRSSARPTDDQDDLRVVLISCRQRRDTERRKTLDNLARVGIHPTVFESPCDPPHPRENRRISLEALTWARGHDVLFLEDDVDADDTLPAWIDLARSQPNPVTFCVLRPLFHPPVIRQAIAMHRPIPVGLYPIPGVGIRWYGTQAIYLPRDLVDFVVTHPRFMEQNLHQGVMTWTGFDLFLREYLPRSPWTLMGAFPNPVQHRDPPKMVERRTPLSPRVSLTYGLPATGTVPTPGDGNRVDALGTHPHYRAHIQPVHDRLPDHLRGTLYQTADALPPSTRPTLVSSYGDLRVARQRNRPVILMEHGAGQVYRRPDGQLLGHPSYAGGRDRYGVILAIVPGPAAAQGYREIRAPYPVIEVGVPKMDPWHDGTITPNLTDPPTIATSFHWDCEVVPETRTSWPRYIQAVADLARHYPVIGHSHPRIANVLRAQYERIGVPYVEAFDEVLHRASVYVCDNSSTMYEFASTGRPVVVLNHRIYRRDVHHGLRFWEAAGLGPMVDHDRDLIPAVRRALRPNAAAAERRDAAVRVAYHATDGQATDRAVTAIVDLLDG